MNFVKEFWKLVSSVEYEQDETVCRNTCMAVFEFGFMLYCFRGNIWCSGCNHHCCINLCFPVYLCAPVVLQVRACLVSYFAVYIVLDVCTEKNGKLKRLAFWRIMN